MSKETKEFLAALVEAVLAIIMFATLFFLFVFATPDQLSGESDWSQEEMRRIEAAERGEVE